MNPPLFAWKPRTGDGLFGLRVARDAELTNTVIDLDGLREPLHLPERALSPGRYWWQWSTGDDVSDVFELEIGADVVVLEVPPAADWLARLPESHPRLHLRPEWHDEVRQRVRADAAHLAEVVASAEALLAEAHSIDEPLYLPPRGEDYAAHRRIWYPTMWNSRKFVKGAEALALAYLVTGDRRYGRAACERMVSISAWDPEGSTYLGHNDEAHMSVIWHGPTACDWAWDCFGDEERARVIEQLCRRGEITFEHMHDRGSYGISRFDSHAGREIVFLANIAFCFHEHIPQAQTWLEWLRPVLCGIWPIWARDDGGWAQGPSYGLAYVTIQTMFASAFKRATGVDVYRRPFWRNHARWRRWVLPAYAQWQGFGDHSQRWRSSLLRNADLLELIGLETGTHEFEGYVEALRAQTEFDEEPDDRQLPGVTSHLWLARWTRGLTGADTAGPDAVAPSGPERAAPELTAPVFGAGFDPEASITRVFPAVGWVALRTQVAAEAQGNGDIAFVFRSSPFGSVSHSHANNNDFILHVGGQVMAMPSGYYGGAALGYGGDHHAHWVWHTKSHNCITLSDAGQLMRSEASTGYTAHPYEDGRLVYWAGVADASYADRAERCRRHVLFLKDTSCFVLVDEYVGRPEVVSALQWNVHSFAPFEVDQDERSFRWRRADSEVRGTFLYHDNAYFRLTEGWDPPPGRADHEPEWPMQYSLRFTCSGLGAANQSRAEARERRNLAVVLAPQSPGVAAAQVRGERHGVAEAAHIGAARVVVDTGKGLEVDGTLVAALAVVEVDGARYTVTDDGIAVAWLTPPSRRG